MRLDVCIFQMFNRGLVTHSVGDDEDAEIRRRQKDRDAETGPGTAAEQERRELRRGACLPGFSQSFSHFDTMLTLLIRVWAMRN